MNNTAKQRRYVGVKEHLAFGIANGGQCMSYTFMASYLTYFFVNVFNVDPVIVSTMLLIEGIWDAINDPLMGTVIDRTRTRFGKMRPYLFIIPVPLAIITCMLFAGPMIFPNSSPTDPLKVAYMIIIYFVWEFCYTISDVPFWGMSAAISPNPDDRSKAISSARFISSILGGLPGIVIAPIIDLTKSGSLGVSLRQVFFILGIVVSVVGMGLFSLAGIFTRERIAQSNEEIKFKDSFIYLFKNKPLLLLVLYNILGALGGIGGMFSNYYYIDVLGSATASLIIGIPGTIVGFVAYAFLPPMKKRFNNKQLLFINGIMAAILPTIVFLIGTVNNNMKNMMVIAPVMMIQGAINAIFNAVRCVIPTEMIADTVDYMEWKTGKRTEGMSFSILTFVGKFNNTVSRSLGVALLKAINYKTSNTNAIVPQTHQTQSKIWALFTIVPAILGLLNLIPLLFYDLVGEKKETMLRELAERREALSDKEKDTSEEVEAAAE